MQESSLNERITRSLAYMLRHQPEEFDLEVDEYGFADFEDVVRALNERIGEPIREEDVVEAIASGDRPRYELSNGVIRALYGHSIEIDAGEPSEPPEELYIAVGGRDAERARRHGLSGGRRTYLHLALTPEEAEETGRRMPFDWLLVTVDAARADEDGIAFFDRQALFLCEHIPTEYLDFGDLQSRSGARPSRGREGQDSRPERGRRPEGGDRGRDRYERPERPAHSERPERPRYEGRDEDDRPARREEPEPARREARREESRPKPAPAPREAPREPARKAAPQSPPAPAGDFGMGILDARPTPTRSIPAAAPPKPPRREPEPSTDEAPVESKQESKRDSQSTFGSGIL
jgi:putative RNA 2'-phosphotransferase